MPETSTENLVRQIKQSRRTGTLLASKVENFLQESIEFESGDDEYIAEIIRKRSIPRRTGIYSPSQLASCLRQTYFTKTGFKKKPSKRIERSGIFLDGHFRHLKWMLVVLRMHQAGIVELLPSNSVPLGAEVSVLNNKGDYGGTIDNLLYLPDEKLVCAVDWKGMNAPSYLRSRANGMPGISYITQIIGYALLANEDKSINLPSKVTDVLIIGENKNGPMQNRVDKSPLGLQEWRYSVEEYRTQISLRLKKLRAYERRQEVPQIECVSTSRLMFKDCPFAYYCRPEVEQAEKNREKRPRRQRRVARLF